MDEPVRTGTAPPASFQPTSDQTVTGSAPGWSGGPPPPFLVTDPGPTDRRFVPLSPRVAVLIGAAIVLGLILWLARDAVRPFILGLLIVYLLDPPVGWLSRRRVPRPLAILLVYVAGFLLVIEFLNLTLTPLVAELRRFIADLPALLAQFETQLQRLSEIYAGLNLPPAIRDRIDAMIASLANGDAIDPGIVVPVLTGAGGVLGAAFGFILLPVWAFYLLKDRVSLTASFDRALPAAWRHDVWAMIRIVERVFGQWIRAQVLLGITVGFATFVGLMLLSELVDPVFGRYALLLSVVAGILELLPIIGPIIAAVPAVLLAATVGWEAVVAALVLYTLIQQVENNALVPKIQGDAVQLHPGGVMFALVIGGSLGGLLGAILALPVAAALRDIVRYLFRRLSPPAEGLPEPVEARAQADVAGQPTDPELGRGDDPAGPDGRPARAAPADG
jgi:predicted PurR-regulated permease PerM